MEMVGSVLTVALLAAGAAGSDPPAQQAVALYDQGRYAEARALLQKLDAEGTKVSS